MIKLVRLDCLDVSFLGRTLDEATLAARRAKWICPEPKIKTGYLARYAKLVTSAARGAVLE